MGWGVGVVTLNAFPLQSNQGKKVKMISFFLNRILQNIQIKTNPEIFAKKKKKGQNNLQFDGNNYDHHADFLTSSVNKNTQKTTKKQTKSSNIIYLNCPVQIFIFIKQCIYCIAMVADDGEVSREQMKTSR